MTTGHSHLSIRLDNSLLDEETIQFEERMLSLCCISLAYLRSFFPSVSKRHIVQYRWYDCVTPVQDASPAENDASVQREIGHSSNLSRSSRHESLTESDLSA